MPAKRKSARTADPTVFYRDPRRSRAALRRIGRDSVEAALDYLYREAMRRPVGPETYAEARRLFRPRRTAPRRGTAAHAVLQEVRRRILPHSMNAAHPRAFCYFTAPPLILSVMGDMLTSMINPGVDIWRTGPAAAFVEEELVRWLCSLAGYGRDSFGILVSGGMHANLTALKVARDRKLRGTPADGGAGRAGEDAERTRERAGRSVAGAAPAGGSVDRAGAVSRGPRDSLDRARVYASEQAHFSIERSLDILGFPPGALRRIACDDRLRMRAEALAEAMESDRRAGLMPFCVVATAGTTSTGSVDPLGEIARIGAGHGAWLHVDAAYGGAVRLSKRHRGRVRDLERYDSVTLDPHKWLFQPHDIGAVLVKRRDDLLDSFRATPEYYRTGRTGAGRTAGDAADQEPLHWYQFGIEGTRRFRGLKLWMSWKHLGSEGLGRLIDRNMALAAHLAERIAASDDFEALPPQPDLSVVCFRHLPAGKKARAGGAGSPPGGGAGAARDVDSGADTRPRVPASAVHEPSPDPALDAHQDRLQRALEISGEGWVSTTRLRGATWLRAGVVNYLSEPADADALLESLRKLAAALDPALNPARKRLTVKRSRH